MFLWAGTILTSLHKFTINSLMWFLGALIIPSSYTTWVCIYLKGWLVYNIWRKDTVKGVMLQRMLICFMKIGNIVWDAWTKRKRSINDIERKDLNILRNIMKNIRKTEKITGRQYSHIEIECEVCKCTVRKCGWTRHIVSSKHKKNLDNFVE